MVVRHFDFPQASNFISLLHPSSTKRWDNIFSTFHLNHIFCIIFTKYFQSVHFAHIFLWNMITFYFIFTTKYWNIFQIFYFFQSPKSFFIHLQLFHVPHFQDQVGKNPIFLNPVWLTSTKNKKKVSRYKMHARLGKKYWSIRRITADYFHWKFYKKILDAILRFHTESFV